MRKLAYIIIGIIFATFTLVSCKDDSIDLEELTEQTILVYMPWSGSATSDGLTYYLKQNLDSIEQAIIDQKGLQQNKLFVMFSTSANAASLYEVKYSNNKIVHNLIKDYSGTDVNTSEAITDIWNTVIANADNSLNYAAMIIGSHAVGWTYKEDWKNYPYYSKQHTNVTDNQESEENYPKTRFFGSVSDIANYGIDIETLAEGIANSNIPSTPGKKLQYILFDGCYMANVESAYALRNVTNYLVASTSEIMEAGMPYHSMWSSISSKTPNYSSMTSTYTSFYKKQTYPYGTLSAINCNNLDELAGVMKDINNGNYAVIDSLKDSIQVLDGFNTPIFYDMKSYVTSLNINSRLTSRFSVAYNKVVASTSATERIYSLLYGSPVIRKLKHYSGMTLSDYSKNEVVLRGREKTEWWKATH